MSTYSRVKTWSSNETLTSSDLNAEFNNIITNTNSGGLNSDNVSTSAAWTWTGTHTMSTSSKLAFIDNIYLTMGSATDGDYLLRYSASSTALELSTTNSDGSGTNAVVVDIQDGTDDVRVRGGLSTNNATAPTTGIVTGGPVLSDTTNTDALGSTSVTWSDLYLGDSAVLAFGEDQDVTLTHDPDDGIFINAGMKLAFRDMGGEYIYSVSDGTLGIAAATEVDITTTTLDVNGVLEVSGNASVGGTLGVTGVGTFTAQSVHTGGIQSGSDIVSDTDSTDDLGTTSVRWANVYADSVGDTGQALAITAGTNAINLTGGDLTLFDDNNNADVSLSLGTSATEALVIQALNGGSNKTLEELRITTKTASGTADHGKMSFYVDEAEIATIDDGGIDLASGKSFTVAGSAIGGSVAADDITIGDAAVSVATTTGNITIDAQANDADVIIKVDDGGSAVTALTLDGSDEGNAIFVNDVQLKSDSALLEFGADLDTTLTHTDGTGLTLNSTNKLTFGDTASFIQQSGDGTLRIDGEVIIDLNASTRVDVSGDLKVGGEVQTANIGYTDGDNAMTIADGGGVTFPQAATFSSDITGLTLNATGDTATSDDAAMGYTSAEGLILTGQGSTSDVTIKNDADGTVMRIPTGTTNVGIGVGTLSAITGRLMTRGVYTALTSGIGDSTIFCSGSNSYSGKQNSGGVLAFGGEYDSSSNITHWTGIAGLADNNTNGNYAGYMAFYTRANGAAAVERMRITSNGYVAIGTDLTASSNRVLHVESASSTCAINTTGQSTHIGTFTASHASYNTYMLFMDATIEAGSGWSFLGCRSDNTGDLQFNLRGDGNAYADGSWGSPASDYAEYFESTDGSALEVGKSIVLDGGKVRVYNDSSDSADDIIGVVRPQGDSKGSTVKGNTAWNHWHNKYLTDDWGVYIREDVTVWGWVTTVAVEAQDEVLYAEGDELPDGKSLGDVKTEAIIGVEEENTAVYERGQADDWTPPEGAVSSLQSVRKFNPEYSVEVDDETNYTPREDRAEWNLIGLLGQVQVKADEPTRPTWIKMKDISDAVELWMIR